MTRLLAESHVLHLEDEAQGKGGALVRGTRWRVRIIDSGDSKSGVHYPLQVLHEAAPLYEGAKVIVRTDEDHVAGRDNDPEKVNGWIDGVEAVPEGLDGYLNLLESTTIRSKMVEAWDRGKTDLLGISMVADGVGKVERVGNRTRTVAKAIKRVRSVDIVVYPAAGGRMLKMVASEGASPGGVHMFDRVMKFLESEHPALHAKLQARLDAGEKLTEEDLEKALQEGATALREAQRSGGSDPVSDPTPKRKPAAAVDDGVVEQLTTLAEAVSGLQKSIQSKDDLVAEAQKAAREAARLDRFVESRLSSVDPMVAGFVREDLPETFTEAEFDQILARHAKRAASLRGFSSPVGAPETTDGAARVVMTEGERIRYAMDGFFAEADQKDRNGVVVPRFKSLRKMYGALTGDVEVSGDFREAQRVQRNFLDMQNPDLWEQYPGERAFVEAVTTSAWAQIFADTLRRSLVRQYQENPQQQWRLLADVIPTPDYRPRHAIRHGGYGKLGKVSEGGTYDAFTSPGDDESTYSPDKYGGTDSVTREAILNDDVGMVRRIPQQMAMAAAYTLNWFVTSSLFAENPNMTGTDTTALFVAGHNNITTSALSATSLAAGHLAMRQQTIAAADADTTWDSATTKRINVQPKYLWVPVDLQQTGWALVVPQNAAVIGDQGTPSFVRNLGLELVVVPHWTDTNNWFLSADKSMGPIIEVAFVQGREDPDILVQDMPQAGLMFTNDTMTFRLRHEYGGTNIGYRMLYGGIVA